MSYEYMYVSCIVSLHVSFKITRSSRVISVSPYQATHKQAYVWRVSPRPHCIRTALRDWRRVAEVEGVAFRVCAFGAAALRTPSLLLWVAAKLAANWRG